MRGILVCLLFLCGSAFGQRALVEQVVAKYKSHRSVSFSVKYRIKTFDSEGDTTKIVGKANWSGRQMTRYLVATFSIGISTPTALDILITTERRF
ncbi:MAG: hypothetical protein EOO50_15625 [Flavobacterium sp.]|uniref:hypothetical protein n=1 Tax=Flavobacterium sp. TaxID=239 RepID=UPI00120991F7|nr:hypothetical protein [Flavobacterium sp.]RZJ64454.1 MAG: hypothetical protein EOO50_15625 [Flavobacterium sp.]